MYLKSLTIKDNDGFIIRHVDFKTGVNIIKGDTTNIDATTSTNSIGKTTLLRSVDFCLAGKWSTLVEDRELKSNRNNTVFNFFKETSPNFELVITKSLKNTISSQMKINRAIEIGVDKKGKETVSVKNFVNDNEVSEDELKTQLKLYLFDLNSATPTFRQLIPKFIRSSDHQVSNIVRYLHPTTSNAVYEVLHLTLFGFSHMGLLNERISVENNLKRKSEQVISLKSLVSIGTEEVNDLRISQLAELQQQYDTYQISQEYERENDQLNQLKASLEKIKVEITNYDIERDVWLSRLKEISTEGQYINSETVKYMYQEAELYNAELQKKFEETLTFHQTMLKNESDYIHSALERMDERINFLQSQYSLQAKDYSTLLEKLGESGSLAEYTALGNQINTLTKEIAESEAIINSYNSAIDMQNQLKTHFDSLSIELEKEIKEFRNKLMIFNQYFSEYSRALSKGGYLLAVETDKNSHFTLIPTPVDGDSHVGDGHKQSIIIAFDLAYVTYINNPIVKIKAPHFFTQDKVEIIDNNVFGKLIQLTEATECQFIFPIIKDKLNIIPSFNESDVILSLDIDNKFFDIENYQIKKQCADKKIQPPIL